MSRTDSAADQGWVRYLLHRCLSHPRAVAGAVAGALGSAVLTAALPLVVRHVVDTLGDSRVPLAAAVTVLIVIGVLRFGLSMLRRVCSSTLSLGVQFDLRSDLFAALVGMPGREQMAVSTGQVVSRAISDITLIQMFLQLIPIVTGNAALLGAALVLMATMSLPLAGIALVLLPALWFVTRRSQRELFPANWDAQAQAAEVAMRVESAVAGVRVVKGFGQERRETGELERRARDLFRSRLRVVRLTSRFTPAMAALPALGQVFILVVGGLLALHQSISLGTFLAFMTYLGSFVSPVRQFSTLLTVSQQGKASLDRVREVIDAGPGREAAVVPPIAAAAAPPRIDLSGVSVRIGDTAVLDHLDLTITAGATVALAGGAGSGKSTLTALLPRLIDPDAGVVRLDGVDVREMPDLRGRVAIVFEDTHLMADTIRANVAYGRPEATDDQVWHALYLAAADDFVRRLPEQLDTPIGERGQRLSGGQRQRLALARALITDAPVLVLDDATSAIDAKVEQTIFERIAAEVQHRTTVVVAHRVSTLALADRVVILDEGRVAESGTLAELQESGALFATLFTPPDVADIGATLRSTTDGVPTEILWAEPAEYGDESRTLEQMARAFSHHAAGAGGFARGGGMMTSAPPSGDVQALIDALPPVTGEPEVSATFTRTADPDFGLRRLLRPFAGPLLAGLGLVALDAIAQILIPVLVRYGIDRGVLVGARDVLLGAAALAAAVVLVDWAISVAQVRVTGRAGERLLFGLRVKTFAQLQRLGLQYYERELGGRIMTRMTTDVDGLSTFLQTGLSTALTSSLTIGGVVIALLVIDARLAVVVLALMPILLAATVWFRRLSVPAYNTARDKVSAVNAYLQENVDNIKVTQAYRREGLNQARFDRLSWEYRDARLRSQTLMAVFFPFIEFLSVVATAAVLAVGVHQVRGAALSAGTLIAFLLYIDLLFAPIQQLSQVFDSYQQAVVGVDRLGRLFAVEVATPQAARPQAVHRVDGAIEVRDVSFRYRPEDAAVLHDVTLRIEPGQRVALVGETGAGKSTLVKLLARYYDPSGGRILVDGTDIREFRLEDYRKRLGVVPQEPYLFGDTVRDAIAYGKADADPAEIEWAARAVGAHEMIAGLDHGYHHPIGPQGRLLSSGQRQLLALARAQLVEPDILILDEATASLDLATEARVRAAIDVLTAGRTTIVVAHRLATAADSDLVAVMVGGRLAEVGPHAELLRADGTYAALWRAYVGASRSEDDRESARL
ncbi:ABC transporter ATP-binding protein [Nocardia sp. BSTN01]|uniref:ABC transporter ATP-binding protein n=1 Tax=Nocardia sp. BSTN01 TaxID=2783665 RepID=UPI00188EF101|nr:ABC transporter ATP-binding protein [Nocardia sp. BSTN01]MBF5000877.1 ABC transporter ATP-binding protein [Nocardia sp. BSTN01]